MPVHTSYPGLYIEELPNLVRTITGAPTSIAVFVGYVHPFQGECADPEDPNKPLWGKPIRIFSFNDYVRVFGPLFRSSPIGPSRVGYAVDQFFQNGGTEAYVVGLRPGYFDANGNLVSRVAGATGTLSQITFTSRHITDDDSKLTVTILNLSKTVVENDTADIVITFGSLPPEYHRGVRLGAAGSDAFIAKRINKQSQLVTVPNDATGYPATFSITGRQQHVDIGAMTPAGTTPHCAQDFIDVFEDKSELDKVDIFNLLAIPGIPDLAIWTKALTFCERKRAFFIMDPPENATNTSIEEMMKDGRIPALSPNGAIYYPFLAVPDPRAGEIRLPPSGTVAGIFARTDSNRGVWKAPAGFETVVKVRGVVEEGRMTDMEQGVLNDVGVNVLRSFPGPGTVVWGARTLVTQNLAFQQWRYVPVRRMALFIEQTLLRNLGWAVFEPNDEPLWSALRASIESFMLSLFNRNAFQGRTPSQAFMVKCDATTTTQTDIDNGIVNIVVGFRPLKPAEFVIIKIGQLAGQVQS